MRATVSIAAPGQLNPFLDRPAQRTVGHVFRTFIAIISALVGGAGIALRQGLTGTRATNTLEYGLDPAVAGITVAAPANAATVTINGQALTGGQKRASGTVTFASAADGDTITVNGLVFTAKTAPSGLYQFARGVSDTADAAAFIAKLNAATLNSSDAVTAAGVFGLIEGSSAAAVATIYAITEGTAGNAYTLASSNGGRLAVSGATLANGAAAANNAWDRIGNDKRTARSLCNCIAASSTDLVSKQVSAACRDVIVTCATVIAGDWVLLDFVKLRAIKETTDSASVRVTTYADDVFGIGANDTATAVGLVNCINNHPKLRERFYATNSAGVVTIRERPPESTSPPPLSSSGSTLAVTGTVNGLFADSALLLIQALRAGHGGNAITIASSSGVTLAIDGSATRLAGGTSTVVTV